MDILFTWDSTDRTLNIAQNVAGSCNAMEYNVPREWQSTDYIAEMIGVKVTESQTSEEIVLSMEQFQVLIDSGSPIGVLYRDNYSGHWILGIGYASAKGHDSLVVSNNPWGGVQTTQTYTSFFTLPDGRGWRWTAR